MNYKWPPTEDQIKSKVLSALDQPKYKDIKDLKILIYWENDPNLMIFDPIEHRAPTEYIKRTYKSNNGRSVFIEIGRID